MTRARSVAALLGAAMLFAFGAFSIHYTSAEGADHHRAWAEAHRMPPPATWITILGWIAIALGAGLVVRVGIWKAARATRGTA